MIDGLKPYPKMKDSGVEWLGRLPESWDVRRAKWLFRKMDRPATEADDVITCFRDGTVTLRKNRRMTGFTESLKEIGYQAIRRGDLVIHGMDAFAGAVGVSDSDGKGTPVYAVCAPIGQVNAYYYAFAVREMARKGWIQALAKGVRERSTDFRFATFAEQLLPLPPSVDQASIVRFLDHADRRIRRYIRAKQKLLGLLEEQKQGVIDQAVTRGLDPNVALKPSCVDWLGHVPEHWAVMPFKRRIGFQEGPGIMASEFRDTGVPLLRISCLQGDAASLIGCNYLDPEAVRGRWSHFAVQERDFLLSASASTGMIVQASKEVAGSIPYTGIIRLWAMNDDVCMGFIRFFITSQAFQDQIAVLKSGVGIEHFGPTHLSRMWIALPPIHEQVMIAEALEGAVRSIQAGMQSIRRQIALLREFRTHLTAAVVTGRLDVREAASRLPDDSALPEPCDDENDAGTVANEVVDGELDEAIEEIDV